MRRIRLTGIALTLLAAPVYADESLIGRYSGDYVNSSGNMTTITLDIRSIDNGVVKGIGTWHSSAVRGGNCRGTYLFTGTLADGQLDVRGDAKGGPGGDCTFRVRATVDGKRLKAKLGQNEFVMSPR